MRILRLLGSSVSAFVCASGIWAQSPGDTVGWTQYDMQSNGSSGNRIAVDSQGGVHFVWTRAMPYPAPRQVYYNYRSSVDEWRWPEIGTAVSYYPSGDGYAQLSLTLDDKAAIGYHQGGAVDSLFYAVDSSAGLGIFSFYHPPNRIGTLRCLWPYLTIDNQANAHFIATDSEAGVGQPQAFVYTRSENGGTTWTAVEPVDTIMTLSPIITSSPVSQEVAIIYTHPLDFQSQWRNDVCYIQSDDGIVWDWANGKVNVTNYGQNGDSLFAYADLDAIYDYNDNLHIIWNAQWVTSQEVHNTTFLLHCDVFSGTISQVAVSDSDWPESGCEFGSWNRQICKMSLGANRETNGLYAVYTRFDSSDCSATGYANGEIYMQYSGDEGFTWSAPENLTNSPMPNCTTGECNSDQWSSLAEKVDDYLHIFYVNDKDAGRVSGYEGLATDNPMLYLAYPNPVTGSAGHSSRLPGDFSLGQNYPNPFNAATRIGFGLLRDSNALLEVFDITGARVAVLVKGHLEAGPHSIAWDADGMASGVYYYRLATDSGALVKKMTLLK